VPRQSKHVGGVTVLPPVHHHARVNERVHVSARDRLEANGLVLIDDPGRAAALPGEPAARPSNFGSASVVTAFISRSLSILSFDCCDGDAGRDSLLVDALRLKRPAT
jgi:hypothetical protein